MRTNQIHKKICNLCGEECEVYTVVDNAPICSYCLGIKAKRKQTKILSEEEMIQKLLLNSPKKKIKGEGDGNKE